jgi:hypothetical protein
LRMVLFELSGKGIQAEFSGSLKQIQRGSDWNLAAKS